MTTGSVSYDSFVTGFGGYVGVKGNRTWSGPDDPRDPRAPPEFHEIHREMIHPKTGKTYVKVYRIRMSGWKPKRAHHTNHAYTKQSLRTEHRLFDFGPGIGLKADFSVFGGKPDWATPNNPFNANDQIKLVGKLREKLQGSDFNMSVFLGEGHQTLRMLGDSAIRIAKSLNHIRRGDILGSAQALFEGTTRRPLGVHDWKKVNLPSKKVSKNAANNWLELQYGWLPLLNDAKECAESIAHYLTYPITTTYRTSIAKGAEGVYSSVPGGIFGKTGTHQWNQELRRSLIAKISEKPSLYATLGLLDPELVVWELIPFSFVADWFIPIGQWMEARALANRLVGTFITTDKQLFSRSDVRFNGAPSGGRYNRLLFDRVISSTLSVPMPTLKPLNKVASWQHCANAVALVTQVFTKNKHPADASIPSKPSNFRPQSMTNVDLASTEAHLSSRQRF